MPNNPEAELLLFENYSHSSSTLSKNSRAYSKKEANEQVCACNRDTYATFEAQFMANLRNTETDLKKSVACKKKRVFDLHGWINIMRVYYLCVMAYCCFVIQ